MCYKEDLINFKYYADIDNENTLDFCMTSMSKEEKTAYEQYKQMPIGPYLLERTEAKGYDVKAGKLIPAKTLICEYVGEVYTHRECLYKES